MREAPHDPSGAAVGSSRAEPASLIEILDRIHVAAGADPVTLDAVMEALRRRSFGPVLLLAGLMTLASLLGDIPDVPTLMAVVVLLTAGQLLCRRRVSGCPGGCSRAMPSARRCKRACHGCAALRTG